MIRSALLTVAQMRAADLAAMAAGTPGYALMRRAGEAAADAASRVVSGGERILIACGAGNNGGDGFVAAEHLRARGYAVEVALLGSMAGLRGDAALAARDWGAPARPLAAAAPEDAALVIDALFGAGLSRPLEGEARDFVERVNRSRRHVLAVDIPSGVDGDDGAVRGAAVRAVETVTFVRRKPGHLLMPGRLHCGRVHVVDIGIDDGIVAGVGPSAFADEPALWHRLFPVPAEAGHKYGRGHTLVCSGGLGRSGAARLAARAALRAGSGLVTVAAPHEAVPENAAQLTAVMLRACEGAGDLAALLSDTRFTAVVAGPGLGVGEGTRAMVRAAASAGQALVLDADALTSFEGEAGALAAILGQRSVLTPHEGEFRRLLAGRDEALRPGSKLERARRAAAILRAVVVLKGADTVIAAPDARAAINATGTPYLATAGSGDILSGIVGALLAQGMPAFAAACAGVWLHGEAGRRFGPGLIAEDLPEGLPSVIRDVVADLSPGEPVGA